MRARVWFNKSVLLVFYVDQKQFLNLCVQLTTDRSMFFSSRKKLFFDRKQFENNSLIWALDCPNELNVMNCSFKYLPMQNNL